MKGKGVTPLWVLGLMSGTSLDGVDAAMVLTDGVEVFDFGPHAYRAYTEFERATIRLAFGQWPGQAGLPPQQRWSRRRISRSAASLPRLIWWGFTARPLRTIRAVVVRIKRVTEHILPAVWVYPWCGIFAAPMSPQAGRARPWCPFSPRAGTADGG